MGMDPSARRRGRYAPSPSGYLHLGNARTALIAWLQMRSAGGQFILRMEDIDAPRCKPEYAAYIIDDLRWLGLDWDEGPDIGGPYSPYTQSERLTLYEEALTALQREGYLYPCFCTRSQLQAIASAPHGLQSEGPVYPGTCRRYLTEPVPIEEKHSLRFAMPSVCEGGDFVVCRSDGIIGYQLAVVVDDAAMCITDVLRGDDLLDSTPRQTFLYRALGLEAPQFVHIPLLYGTDGKRLSKRHGSVTLQELRSEGVAPERVIGYLAYWSGLLKRPEPVAARDLIAAFKLGNIHDGPVVVTESMLRFNE